MGRQKRRQHQMQPVAMADLEVREDGVVGREPDAVISRNLGKIGRVELLDVAGHDVGYERPIDEHRRQKPKPQQRCREQRQGHRGHSWFPEAAAVPQQHDGRKSQNDLGVQDGESAEAESRQDERGRADEELVDALGGLVPDQRERQAAGRHDQPAEIRRQDDPGEDVTSRRPTAVEQQRAVCAGPVDEPDGQCGGQENENTQRPRLDHGAQS